MFKKVIFVLFTCFSILFNLHYMVRANSSPDIININEKKPRLTDEQKQLLKQKQDELRDKYLNDWKNKSDIEKKRAMEKYKKELDEFCQEKFGMSHDELKVKYHDYFKKIFPR